MMPNQIHPRSISYERDYPTCRKLSPESDGIKLVSFPYSVHPFFFVKISHPAATTHAVILENDFLHQSNTL
jgi:hypothetical protein